MNIDLRFKEKLIVTCHPSTPDTSQIVRILQFRWVEHGSPRSEWKDVPCVGVDDD